ncbi:hypothetical protein [Streptomyces sp. NRRL F-5123]|uniref:hypothetical protein n=1 Tax=Streptomyces sp. NRRL F-5123 TaxID=1463856 RepID=UPI0004E23DB3|nr:hypothetical protein [Streptomyces sp. NRRL F-5123]
MLTAAAWYKDGDFWQFAVTTVVALALGALGALATVRASNPKRRLVYRTLANTSLFVASHSATSALMVTHGITPVLRPRVIELELKNGGRKDITLDQFHAGAPIKYDLGADIVAVLDVSTEPTGSTPPVVEVDPASRNSLTVKPFLLARKQVVRISILVDGAQADVQFLSVPLVDVDRREGAAVEEPHWTRKVTDNLPPIAFCVTLVFVAADTLFRS